MQRKRYTVDKLSARTVQQCLEYSAYHHLFFPIFILFPICALRYVMVRGDSRFCMHSVVALGIEEQGPLGWMWCSFTSDGPVMSDRPTPHGWVAGEMLRMSDDACSVDTA